MTLDLNQDQSQAVMRGETVRLSSHDLGEVVVLQLAAYEEALAEERERAGWSQLGKKAAERWGQENPFES
jgi:hypothetical protein